MIVAMAPGTWPIPKRTMTGTRYASDGIVCMKSRIGLMMAENLFDLAAQIPNGIARMRARITATTTRDKVCMVLLH